MPKPDKQESVPEAQSAQRKEPDALAAAGNGLAYGAMVGAAIGAVIGGFGYLVMGGAYVGKSPSPDKDVLLWLVFGLMGALFGAGILFIPGALVGLLLNVILHASRRSLEK